MLLAECFILLNYATGYVFAKPAKLSDDDFSLNLNNRQVTGKRRNALYKLNTVK